MKKLLASLILLSMVISILAAASSMSDGVSVEYIPPAFNLGIGYISPSAKLHVNGSMLVRDTILFNAEYSNTSSSSILVDWNSGNRQYISLAHDNITVKFKEPISQKPGSFILVIEQDGTGSRDVTTWKNGNCLNVDVKWPEGTNPDLTDTARGIDTISCIYRFNTYTNNGEFLCVPSLDFSV